MGDGTDATKLPARYSRMKVASKKTISSKLPGYETVSFTLNKMTEGRRIQLSIEHADPMAEYRQIQADINDILATVPENQKDTFKFDNQTSARLWSLIN